LLIGFECSNSITKFDLSDTLLSTEQLNQARSIEKRNSGGR